MSSHAASRQARLEAVDGGLATLQVAVDKVGWRGTAEFRAPLRYVSVQASRIRRLLPPNGSESVLDQTETFLLTWLERADKLAKTRARYKYLEEPGDRFRPILRSVNECEALAEELGELKDTLESLAPVSYQKKKAATDKAAAKDKQDKDRWAGQVSYDELIHPVATRLFESISQGRPPDRQLRLRLGGAPRTRSLDDYRSLDLLISNSWEGSWGWLPVRLQSKPTDEMKRLIETKTETVSMVNPLAPLKTNMGYTNRPASRSRSSFLSTIRGAMPTKSTLKQFGSKMASVVSFERVNGSTLSVGGQSTRSSRPAPADETWWRLTDAKSHGQIYDHLDHVDPVFMTHLHNLELDGSGRWLLHKHASDDRDGYEGEHEPQQEHSLSELAYQMRWGENQKMAILFHLAYALSCYYESPWLTGHWGPDNISFFRHASSGIPCEPWLKLSAATPRERYRASDKVRHPQVVELGILAIELELKQPIAQALGAQPAADMHGRWGQACKVWNDRLQNGRLLVASRSYREAIDFCLSEGHSSDRAVFRRMIWDEVVRPLGAALAANDITTLDLAGIPDTTASQYTVPNGTWTPFSSGGSINNAAVTPVGGSEGRPSAGPSMERSTPYHAGMERLNGLDKALSDAANLGNVSTRLPYRAAAPAAPAAPTATTATTSSTAPTAPATFADPPTDSPAASTTPPTHTTDGGTATQAQKNSTFWRSKKWIDDFAELAKKYKEIFPNRRVKVALLDTGIDSEHTDLRTFENGVWVPDPRIKEIYCWVDEPKGRRILKGYDKCGHGTFIAAILLKLCPFIELYVARISKTQELGIGQASKVARALRHAKDTWRVDIVSLSLGYEEPIREIETAIDHLTAGSEEGSEEGPKKQILVFAAAGNDGFEHAPSFPASCGSVFAVYSTNAIGKWSDFNSARENSDSIAILGEDIESANLTTWNCNNATRFDSGTSYATPIAVSLAAFLFAVVPDIVPDYGKCYYKVDRVDGMKKLVKELASVDRQDQFLYPNVVRYFREKNFEEVIAGGFRNVLREKK